MDLVEIWRNALGELEVSLSKANFVTWFRNTFVFDYKKGVFTIGVPNFFYETWLKDKYFKEIQKALQGQIDEPIQLIKFKIATPRPDQVILFDKDKVIHSPVDKSGAKEIVLETATLPHNITLNEDYTFQNFVVGPSNQFAHAASMAVAAKPGSKYNPLYIYGDSGLGKTHLIQAIGHSFLEANPDKTVLYVTTETFLNDFIQAVGSGFGRAKDFKNRYRSVDLLLIDDIQFLSTKEQTQDEFFHTFNQLYQNKKQVVLTSDRPPKEIQGLETRLKTRFEGGMVTDIGLPDLETREAILRHKASNKGLEIDSKIVTLIAGNIKSSIRELEGALNKIIITCELTDSPLTIEKANEILASTIEERKSAITPELVIREIGKYFHVSLEDLLGHKRTKELVTPRQIAMYLLRHECDMSYPDIGRKMGGKDHSTIMHGCHKIDRISNTDPELKKDISNLKDRVFAYYK